MSAQAKPTALVLDRVTVVDVEYGERLRDQRVVVVGTRIQAVGNQRTVAIPRGAQVVDARGGYLIPGLWDMHFHQLRYANGAYRQLIANGITGIRDAGAEPPLDTLNLWKREILAGKRVGPRQVVAGPSILGCPAAATRRTAHTLCVDTPARMRYVVDSLRMAGADFIKSHFNNAEKELFFALAAAARQARIPFGGHLPRGVTGLEASDSGAQILDHYTYTDDCDGEKIDVAQCSALAARLRRNATWVTDFPSGARGNKRPPDSVRVAFRRRAMRYAGPMIDGITPDNYGLAIPLPTGVWKPLSTAERAQLPSGADWVTYVGVDSVTGRPGGCDAALAHQAATLPRLANTDFPITGAGAGTVIHLYLLNKVLCGLPPLAVLQTATLNPALALHAADSLGTVAVGKIADLVLLEGDPLVDMWNVSKIRAVVANGRYFDRSALDQLLVDADAEYRKDDERRTAGYKKITEQRPAGRKDTTP